MTKAVIKQIPGFWGHYYADNFGHIYSMHNKYGKLKNLRKLKPHPNSWGRLLIDLWVNGHRHTKQVHRLILETFIGTCPVGMEACHGKNGFRDNSLCNLYYATHQQNVGLDRLRDGTDNRGEKHGMSKLNQVQVRVIRRLRGVISQSEVARLFNVDPSLISLIYHSKRWGWM